MINAISKFNFLITIIFLNSSMLIAQKNETQEYQVIDQIDNAEIRFYPSAAMIKVSAEQNRNNNFGKLFRYIAGNNQENQEIAMTTPVYMYDENKAMEFVLPKKYLSEGLPIPNDKDLEAYISNPKYFAAIRYSGYSNANKIQKHRNELKSILENNGLEIISDFYVLSYDSPTKVYNRRNEILFEISYKDKILILENSKKRTTQISFL
ncbi:MAG: heme-binding protein [Flavobacteriaceae bacterium]|nr:heme-binding protein [Flavobacteriaceae bacterium]MBL6678913.1 heme-binding protein [Flavobacteriaceae bacterium]